MVAGQRGSGVSVIGPRGFGFGLGFGWFWFALAVFWVVSFSRFGLEGN